MNILKDLFIRLLSKFNLHVIKLPTNISIGKITQNANEFLATSLYIKQLVSIFYIQKRFHEIYKLVDLLIPADYQYLHINWIKNYSSGRGSLDIYRVVKKNNSVLFLKYYFKDSMELSRALYFSENLFEKINYFIPTSKLIQTRNSELISELGFEFINSSEKICANDVKEFIIYIIITLNKNFKLNSINKSVNIPKYLLNYKSHFEYKRSKTEIIERFSEKDIKNVIGFFESKINPYNYVLSHGDLHTGNIINKILIDWDNFGYYPLGFDAAFATWKFNIKFESKKTVMAFKETNFLKNISTNEKDEFNRNFILFLLVFTRNNFEWMSKFLLEKMKEIKKVK
jgi:hypothetical protein